MTQRTWNVQGIGWEDPYATPTPFSYETASGPMTGVPWWDENANSYFMNQVTPARQGDPSPMTVYDVPSWLAPVLGEERVNRIRSDIERSLAGGEISLTAPSGGLTEDGRQFSVQSGNRWSPDWGRFPDFGEEFYNRVNPNWRNIEGLSKGTFGGINLLDPNWGVQDWRLAGVSGGDSFRGLLQGLAPVAAVAAPFIAGWAAPALAGATGLSQGAANAVIRGGISALGAAATGGNPLMSIARSGLGYGLGQLGGMLGSDGGMALAPGDIGNDPSLGLEDARFENVGAFGAGGGDMWDFGDGWDFGPGNFMDQGAMFDFAAPDLGGFNNGAYFDFFNTPEAQTFDQGSIGWMDNPNDLYSQFFNDPGANSFNQGNIG